MIKFLFLIVFFLHLPSYIYATCLGASPNWIAASCGWQDIRDCQTVASDGDTINVPTGTCVWGVVGGGCTDDTCINLTITKAIKIIGAGIDSTIINANNTYSANCYSVPFKITNAAARISGMTINDSVNHGFCGSIYANGDSTTGARIDHIKFGTLAGRSIVVSNANGGRGVVDHCIINSGAINIVSNTKDWASTFSLGNANAWFFENNEINYSSGSNNDIDCERAGRVVWRYNTFNVSGSYSNQIIGNHGCDTVPRGCMHMEVYNNTFNNKTVGSIYAIQSRSGTGRIFNNIINGAYVRKIEITNYRSCTGSAGSACRSDVCEKAEGWPCQDQIGRTGGGTGLPPQTSSPLYVWNNGANAIVYNPGITPPCYHSSHIQVNRDFYTCTDASCAPVGYTPYTYPHPRTLTK